MKTHKIVIINELRGSKDDPAENTQVDLNTITKGRILSLLTQAVTYPDRFSIAIAESLPEADLPEAKDLMTLNEWLEEQGISLDKRDKHKLANLVAKNYKLVFGGSPRTITRPNDRGHWNIKASGFMISQLWLLEASMKQLRGEEGYSLLPESFDPAKEPEVVVSQETIQAIRDRLNAGRREKPVSGAMDLPQETQKKPKKATRTY